MGASGRKFPWQKPVRKQEKQETAREAQQACILVLAEAGSLGAPVCRLHL